MSNFDDFGNSSYSYGSSDSYSRIYNYSVSHALSGGNTSSAITAYSLDRIVVLRDPPSTEGFTENSKGFIDSKDVDTINYPTKNKFLYYFFLIFELIVAIIVLIPAIALLLS